MSGTFTKQKRLTRNKWVELLVAERLRELFRGALVGWGRQYSQILADSFDSGVYLTNRIDL